MKNDNFTQVNTDDEFLRGFYSAYPDEQWTPSSPSQPATTLSAWERSRKELSNKGITSVTAEPKIYKYITGYDPLFDENARTTEVRALREEGINPIYDPFLDGFNEGYEDEQKPGEVLSESPSVLPSKRGNPYLDYSGYTGAWEAVQPDTAGSGFQIRAWNQGTQPKTEEELQAAYEEAKAYYESVLSRSSTSRSSRTIACGA